MLSEKLKNSRTELHLTQQEVADRIHISRQMISNWEMGKNYPDIPTLIDLSELYGLTLDYMLKDDQKYINQVRDDYQLIEHVRNHRWIDKGIIVSLILLLVPMILIPFISTKNELMAFIIFIMLMIVPLIYLSYRKYLSFFKGVPDKIQPLMVPKAFGMGIGINPRHPLGKFIWWLMIILVLVVFGLVLYQIITTPGNSIEPFRKGI
ncbi:hypothetical protein RD055328_03460 [Companilactobacillus sp. RD055328]|uniref:helix-turn-helix domain-containing protein n=1 Tax=Companilactobacillus sp. RD055328 TaxID=2916634 RepID=UPI001FC88318|nr:helix-turn-helix transcriptional regulator [Companilactobacillus sp. RD055328]GKQ42423.1 hypothetical protein RD055328_03460 [Companilactobacillus sp. RD055328]